MKALRYVLYAGILIFAVIGMLFVGVFFAMQFGLLNVRGSITERNKFFYTSSNEATAALVSPCIDTHVQECAWSTTPEWAVISAGLSKDKSVIDDVSIKSGVSARMIAAAVVPEQMRFFTAEREVFKRYFEPLKILGSMSQFSLGVSGIKEETALKIEEYAASTTSPFYPGPGIAELITYAPGVDQKGELYNRLTDAKNHYYSYLYTAIFLKEIESQWKRKGFTIDTTPGVLITLFNIGFAASHPNSAPETGGAIITTGGQEYTYGDLGARFYTSQELALEFPI